MTSEIQIRKCTTLPDFHRSVEIQRAVWGESDLETEPYTTFVVANPTGLAPDGTPIGRAHV